MKRSTAVVLVLSGAILSGCRREEPKPAAQRESQVVTNDTYIAGRGYYHSSFHGFYPFPYNYYAPGRGYYRGGAYHPQPDLTAPKPTYPGRSFQTAQAPAANVNRGGFTRTSTSRSSGWSYRSSGS
ncbi:MAG TPA: hypothetical protein VM680_13305 [Verrucomicrobiae bacterium]|nr:hypothetical protein [Verrucomicrobiae bacterium]